MSPEDIYYFCGIDRTKKYFQPSFYNEEILYQTKIAPHDNTSNKAYPIPNCISF